MQPDWIGKRVELLELSMEGLKGLPDAVNALGERVSALERQILQQRTEMGAEFSAVRKEMRSLNDETRTEMRSLNDETRAEMRKLNDETCAELRKLNAETQTQMRVLHEEVLSRITTLGEGGGPLPARRKRPRN